MAAGVGICGGILSFLWSPGIKARSAVQHFAAGVVIAAVASELIPEVEKIGTPSGVIGGFAAGGVAMVALKWLVLKFEKREKAMHRGGGGCRYSNRRGIDQRGVLNWKAAWPTTGGCPGSGALLLNLSVGTEFHKWKSKGWQGLAVTTGIAFLLLLGAVAGFWLLQGISQPRVAVFLSFGAAALIYLVAEELLVESIQAEESLFSTAMLFTGFLVVLAFKLFGQTWA